MDDLKNQHALRYAVNAGKNHVLTAYRNRYPDLFSHFHVVSRPAGPEDFYLPPPLTASVTSVTRFDETGCRRFACFPFKEGWEEACREDEPPSWVRVGGRYELACQPSCRHHSVDADWTPDGRCVLANPLKKALASMPERLFERSGGGGGGGSRSSFHDGLDVGPDGKLALNAAYCEAYGLDFADGDCAASGAQSFGEWLLGTTVVRAAKTAGKRPRRAPSPPPPTELPDYLSDKSAPLVVAVAAAKKRRVRGEAERTALAPPSNEKKEEEENEEQREKRRGAFRELALEMSKDLGRTVSEWALENFLRKKAPGFYVSALDRIAYRLVLKHSVTQSLRRMGTTGLRAIGKGVGAVTNVYALYELGAGILDVLDPYDFEKVIDKKTLDEIDRELDYAYFKEGPVRPELTLDYLWENDVLPLDASDVMNVMAASVEEYLDALDPSETLPEVRKDEKERKEEEEHNAFSRVRRRRKSLHAAVFFLLVCLALAFVDWIHVWTCCAFFYFVYRGDL